MSINFNSTRCNYCERKFTESNYRTKEHIVPLSKGGNNYFENLIWICNECNNYRGNKDLPYFFNQINNVLNNNRTIKIKIYTYNRQDLQNMVKNLSYYKNKSYETSNNIFI
jgi:hypothetical protein